MNNREFEHKRVLVLGSSGLIGSELVKSLELKGLDVEEYDIQNNLHQDLANHDWNSQLEHSIWQADFVYFLAFDVGGAKYLGNRELTYNFIHNNVKIMSNVFEALNMCKKPFIFASSMMAKMPWSTYGNLKRIGEAYTLGVENGAAVRFWNVYGKEEPGEKSHVITDFCHQAADEGKITMISHGKEQRQFIHVTDAVGALETIRENWFSITVSSRPPVFDVSSGNWVKIATIAKHVARQFDDVEVILGKQGDSVQKNSKQEPDLKYIQGHPYFWKPSIPLPVGIKWMADGYKKNAQD